MPPQPHHHRPARRLRPRPHHRRLPPRGALRRRSPHRGEEGRARRAPRSIMREEVIRHREELAEQIRALQELAQLGEIYGFDISRPARNFQEAVQWLYFGYLAAVKEQNGAAMSIGRNSTFLDIYAKRDLRAGTLTEAEVQELIDHFVMKLRMVKFARTPEYNELFSGDPHVGHGVHRRHGHRRPLDGHQDGLPLPAHPREPGHQRPSPTSRCCGPRACPRAFKRYCAKISIDTSSIQYENDDLMRVVPRRRLRDRLLRVLHAHRQGDAVLRRARQPRQVPALRASTAGVTRRPASRWGRSSVPSRVTTSTTTTSWPSSDDMMAWLASVYVNSLNIIHYMHDKYCYERLQMALHDEHVHRWFAYGHRGPLRRGRLPLRHQVRQGQGRPRRDAAS